MKHFIFILNTLFVYFYSFAQTTKFDYKISYNYRFQEDKKDTNSRKNEEMLLFVAKDASYFVSAKKLAMDTILQKETNFALAMGRVNSLPKPKVNFEVVKNRDSKNSYFELVGLSLYKVSSQEIIDWKFEEGTKQIGKYTCKKARTTFAGRNYTAWYSEEIPLSEGPCKFRGLPGLILEMYDDRQEHYFSLLSLEKKTYFLDLTHKQDQIVELKNMQELEQVRANRLENLKSAGFDIKLDPQKEKELKEKMRKKQNHIEML
jgi:GLPGLI family protein